MTFFARLSRTVHFNRHDNTAFNKCGTQQHKTRLRRDKLMKHSVQSVFQFTRSKGLSFLNMDRLNTISLTAHRLEANGEMQVRDSAASILIQVAMFAGYERFRIGRRLI
jgi:hypothetical protein